MKNIVRCNENNSGGKGGGDRGWASVFQKNVGCKVYLTNSTDKKCLLKHKNIRVEKLFRISSRSLRVFQLTGGLGLKCRFLIFLMTLGYFFSYFH